MNNRQAFLRTQLPSTERISAIQAPLVVTLFHWFALALLVLTLLTASLANAQAATDCFGHLDCESAVGTDVTALNNQTLALASLAGINAASKLATARA